MYYFKSSFNVLSLIIKFYLLVITGKKCQLFLAKEPCSKAIYIFMPAFGQGQFVRVNGHYIREIYNEYM